MTPDAGEVQGEVLEDRIVDPRGHYAREIRQGEVLRIIDIQGQQVADFLAFNLNRLEERLSPENTVNLNRSVFPKVGYTLFSDEAGKLMTIIADTCGVHDMLAGACSRFTNEYRYGVPGQLRRRRQTLGPELEGRPVQHERLHELPHSARRDVHH